MRSLDRLLVLLTTCLNCILSSAEQAYPLPPGRNRSGSYVYQINFPYHVLHEDVYHPAYLKQDLSERYLFLIGDQNSSPLTIMITPCSSAIIWSVHYKNENQTGKLDDTLMIDAVEVSNFVGKKTHIFNKSNANRGLYIVQVTAIERDTHINMYASRYHGLLVAQRLQQKPKIRLQRRKHKNKMTVRWEESVIKPEQMHYCVVVNTRRNYDSLCEARSDLNGVLPSGLTRRLIEDEVTDDRQTSLQTYNDIKIGCVGKRLSYTVDHLEHGKVYYFNLFSIEKKRNLTLPYGNVTIKYDKKLHPLGLRDNKPLTVNLRRLDGRASFHYKVSEARNVLGALEWHITPCGGAVDVEIRQNCSVVARHHVEGYKRLQVASPKPGQRFVLKLFVSNYEELRRISGVEVLATMRGTSLPLLPEELKVNEYISLRRCNSVTVGWIPALDDQGQPMRYCVSATLVTSTRRSEIDFRSRPNQCNLETRLKEEKDFSVRHCQDISANDNQNVIVQEIYRLKPGSEYIIQVTVKKTKGKMLSYDLLRVHTKSKCS